jgi:hypothetical protein
MILWLVYKRVTFAAQPRIAATVGIVKIRAVEEESEREDTNPSHRGTAEPIWLAGFYEVSPSPLSEGKKKKKEPASERQTAGEQPLIGRDRGKRKRQQQQIENPLPFAQWMQPSPFRVLS